MKKKLKMINLRCIFLLLGAFIFSTMLQAQSTDIQYPGEPLKQRIERIIKTSHKNIVYDSKLVEPIKVSSLRSAETDAGRLLSLSLKSTGLTFKKMEDGSYIIKKDEEKKPDSPQQKTSGKGSLSGTVVDERGESIPGATVIVPNTTLGTATDLDGKYRLDGIPAGVTTIQISFMSYQTMQVNDVNIAARETTPLDVVLKEASTELGEVVVIGSAKANTQAGLLALQKIAPVMSDGISAQQIAKAPDSNVAAALKRITGVTTMDNKYVVVRSMGERWNTAAMDGVSMPSTEAYSNNFSFDIIPTAMVEGVVISKTATPDMNANFAGGYVEIKTKDIPNEDFLTFGVGTSYNDLSTNKDFLTRQRGKHDYWGYDDGTRDFPKGLKAVNWNDPVFFEQSKLFKDNFTTYKRKADPGSSFQLAMGKSFDLKNYNKWGFAAALTSKNEQTTLNIDHTARGNWKNASNYNPKWREEGTAPVTFHDFKNTGASYNYNATLAAMLNLGLQLGKNRLSFRNAYTHIYDNTLTRTTGFNEYWNAWGPPAPTDLPYTKSTTYPVYQTLWQNKLEGSHTLGKVELNWFAARTQTASDTKDHTDHNTLSKYMEDIGGEVLTYHQVYNSASDFSRGYIESRETDYNFGASLKWSLGADMFKTDLKTGYAGALKNNTNQQEKFFLRVDENRSDVPNTGRNQIELYGSLADWFNGDYYVPGGIGWQTRPLYTDGKFEGKVTQHSPYVMFDHRLNSKFRLVWGMRAEYYKYELISQQLDEADSRSINVGTIEDKPWQFLPSANFTYSLTSSVNLRLSYNKAVLRPQFNERTGLPYFDPVANSKIYNTPITSSVVNNYDFKAEWFLGPGEIISAGVYYKDIDRPIERLGYVSGEGTLYLFNTNSKNAKLKGVEVEVRKSLGFIAPNSFLDRVFISGNFTYNQTEVTAFTNKYLNTNEDVSYVVDRPLYGQTPWAYNLGVMYDGERLGLSFMHNAKGDQYITVGEDYMMEELQRPYTVTDAQLSYKLLKDKNFEVRLNVKNLFDSVKEYYDNNNSYKEFNPNYETGMAGRQSRALTPGATDKYDKGIDDILFRSYSGRTFSLSLKYNFQ